MGKLRPSTLNSTFNTSWSGVCRRFWPWRGRLNGANARPHKQEIAHWPSSLTSALSWGSMMILKWGSRMCKQYLYTEQSKVGVILRALYIYNISIIQLLMHGGSTHDSPLAIIFSTLTDSASHHKLHIS